MSIAAKSVPAVTAEKFKEKIAAQTAKVGILGLGYVGLPLALLFSEERFPVTGFDVDARKVDTLAKGGSYIVRIEASEIQVCEKTRIFVQLQTFLTFQIWTRSLFAFQLRWTNSASLI